MAGWLAYTVVLMMPVVDGPICAGAGTFLNSCLMPPSPYLQQVLHQHHLGKFFHLFCLV